MKIKRTVLSMITLAGLIATAPVHANLMRLAVGDDAPKVKTPSAALVSIPQLPADALPFLTAPVLNPERTLPDAPMLTTPADIQQLKGYLPASIADAADLPEQYRSATAIQAGNDYKRERGDHLPEILSGNRDSKRIALTFDDGPHPQYTLPLLSTLKSLHVPATFFVVGKEAVKCPAVVQLEAIDGNEVGNHTFDHVDLSRIAPSEVPYEIDECDEVLRHILGTAPRFFRPPGGQYDPAVLRAATAHGYITTLWTDDPADYTGIPGGEILQRTLAHLRPGGIILLHDGMPQTIDMLPEFVAKARAMGYTFVTMSALAGERGSVE